MLGWPGGSGMPGRDQARKISSFIGAVSPLIWALRCSGFYILKNRAETYMFSPTSHWNHTEATEAQGSVTGFPFFKLRWKSLTVKCTVPRPRFERLTNMHCATPSRRRTWDFPGSSVVKDALCPAGGAGSVPGWRTEIPHATGQLNW